MIKTCYGRRLKKNIMNYGILFDHHEKMHRKSHYSLSFLSTFQMCTILNKVRLHYLVVVWNGSATSNIKEHLYIYSKIDYWILFVNTVSNRLKSKFLTRFKTYKQEIYYQIIPVKNNQYIKLYLLNIFTFLDFAF